MDVPLLEVAIVPEYQNYLHVVPTRKLESLRVKAAHENRITGVCRHRRIRIF